MNDDYEDRAIRLPIELLIECKSEEQELDEFCTNLSSSGMFIETTNVQPINTTVELKFTLPHTQEKLIIAGIVKWSKAKSSEAGPAGMGIQFEALNISQKCKLKDAIQYFQSVLKN